jgi:hypothetical protein
MKSPQQIAEQYVNALIGINPRATVTRSMLVETITNAIREALGNTDPKN